MFRKQDFKKVDLLGSGKKNTKIYKALHLPSGKYYALKEVEAKTLDKLNEYKEEAVQLFKAQHHPNIIQFYGYFFYETMYNTFRIGIVCEYIEHRQNLEYVFRKRKQMGIYWKSEEMERMIISLISTLSYMQSVGLCHRDLKPANLFLLNNGEIKVIDFGESKDYFREADDGGDGTTATIRGTPQYLSPILWKAHVVDGNSRFAKHNIYKSDVFSVGLLFYQLAGMDDVTGFNQKSPEYDGEKLVEQGLKKLRQKFSEQVVEILRLMLKFQESDRPSFIELSKLVIKNKSPPLSPTNAKSNANNASGVIDSSQKDKEQSNSNNSNMRMYIDLPNLQAYALNKSQNVKSSSAITSPMMKQGGGQQFQQQTRQQFQQEQFKENDQQAEDKFGGRKRRISSPTNYGGSPKQPMQRPKSNQNFIGAPPNDMTESTNRMDLDGGGHFDDEEEELNRRNNLLTQAELFRNYAEQNQLYCNQTSNVYWFEYGGNKIGKIVLDITQPPPFKEDESEDGGAQSNPQKSQVQNSNAFRWKLIGKYKNEFSPHFTLVFIDQENGFYMIGGNGNTNTCLHYDTKTIKIKASMPQEKTFFPAVLLKGIIYTFGGYDAYDKVQLSTCEYYSIEKDQWFNSPHCNTNGQVEYKLVRERSQCSACIFDDESIFIFGGYHRNEGTLNSIEKFTVKTKRVELIELKMPSPLRRFVSLKISQTKILLIGGILRMSKESDAVFCFDLEKEYTIEQLDKIDKPGIIDYPIILDQVGNLHLFLENNSGTSPPNHVVYSFLEYS